MDVTVALAEPGEDGEPSHVYCAAVWVSEKYILTAAHCTNIEKPMIHFFTEGENVEVYAEPTTLHAAKLVSRHEEEDLALLESLGGFPHAVATLGPSPVVGDAVSVVGHPSGFGWTLVRGIVGALRGPDAPSPEPIHGPFLQLSACVWFGNSGGGAFDSEGRLIGISSFITRAPCMAFFVAPSTIRKFLVSEHELN